MGAIPFVNCNKFQKLNISADTKKETRVGLRGYLTLWGYGFILRSCGLYTNHLGFTPPLCLVYEIRRWLLDQCVCPYDLVTQPGYHHTLIIILV